MFTPRTWITLKTLQFDSDSSICRVETTSFWWNRSVRMPIKGIPDFLHLTLSFSSNDDILSKLLHLNCTDLRSGWKYANQWIERTCTLQTYPGLHIIDSIFCQEIAAIFELFEYRHILAIAFYVAVLIEMYLFDAVKIVTFLRPYTFSAHSPPPWALLSCTYLLPC